MFATKPTAVAVLGASAALVTGALPATGYAHSPHSPHTTGHTVGHAAQHARHHRRHRARRTRRPVTGIAGQQGATGPQGPPGPPGPRGATGSVDTSGFYTKGQSDGRHVQGTGREIYAQIDGKNVSRSFDLPGGVSVVVGCQNGTPSQAVESSSATRWFNVWYRDSASPGGNFFALAPYNGRGGSIPSWSQWEVSSEAGAGNVDLYATTDAASNCHIVVQGFSHTPQP